MIHANENTDDIQYWLAEYRIDNDLNSDVEAKLWSAEKESVLAELSVELLQCELDMRQAEMERAAREVRRLRREAQSPENAQLGRPKMTDDRRELLARFTQQWIRSVMNVLRVNNARQLEKAILGSRERNWRRWLSDSVPTASNLMTLRNARVTVEGFEGVVLADLQTTPGFMDLYLLARLV